MEKESTSKPACGNCRWYEKFIGVCCNGKSPYAVDYKDEDESCEEYEEG